MLKHSRPCGSLPDRPDVDRWRPLEPGHTMTLDHGDCSRLPVVAERIVPQRSAPSRKHTVPAVPDDVSVHLHDHMVVGEHIAPEVEPVRNTIDHVGFADIDDSGLGADRPGHHEQRRDDHNAQNSPEAEHLSLLWGGFQGS